MVSRGRTYPRYRCGGRFLGRRVNCEQVPLLPAATVARMLEDPRKIPYLLVWKSSSDDTVQEAARIAPYKEIEGMMGAVEIKRHDGTRNFIRTVLRPLPRNGGRARLLICPYCQTPRRGLYRWEPGEPFNTSAVRSNWACRACNNLRYASEGGALVVRGRGAIARMFEATFGRPRSDRPEPWFPLVFNSPEEAAAAGIPTAINDERKLEDIVDTKDLAADVRDSLRYGLYSQLAPREVSEAEKPRQETAHLSDATNRAIFTQKKLADRDKALRGIVNNRSAWRNRYVR